MNGLTPRFFHTNTGVPQGSISGPKLFLIDIDLRDVISFKIGIYVDVTPINSCLINKSDRSDKINLATALENDLQLVAN